MYITLNEVSQKGNLYHNILSKYLMKIFRTNLKTQTSDFKMSEADLRQKNILSLDAKFCQQSNDSYFFVLHQNSK